MRVMVGFVPHQQSAWWKQEAAALLLSLPGMHMHTEVLANMHVFSLLVVSPAVQTAPGAQLHHLAAHRCVLHPTECSAQVCLSIQMCRKSCSGRCRGCSSHSLGEGWAHLLLSLIFKAGAPHPGDVLEKQLLISCPFR